MFSHHFISFLGGDKLRWQHSEIQITVDCVISWATLPLHRCYSCLSLTSWTTSPQIPTLLLFLVAFPSPFWPSAWAEHLPPPPLCLLYCPDCKILQKSATSSWMSCPPPALPLNHFPLPPPPSTQPPSLYPASSVLLRKCGSVEQGFCFKVQGTD